MLLHATVVVLFGTSHGGGAGRVERGLDDVLDVTLSRQLATPDLGLRSGPGVGSSVGQDLLRRRDEHLPPAPVPAIEPPQAGVPSPAEPTRAAPGEAERVAPRMPLQAVEPLPRIDLRAPQKVDRPLAPPTIAPPTIERLEPPANPPALAAPVELAPPAIPLVPAVPIERLAAPAAQHELAPPVELAPRVAPALPEAPIERLAAPAAQHELAPPVELTPRVAPVLPAPLDRLTTPKIEHQLAPAPTLTVPAVAAPIAAPSDAAAAPIERTAPPAGARPAPASEAASPRSAPDARGEPKTDAELPRLRLGAPAGDDDIFKPRRDAGATSGDGPPSIDLDAAHKRAREIASEATGTRGILPALPPPPERKSKESIALEKAIKPDCRTAYAGMGLLAVPALVASTIGDGGCRW